MNIIIILVSCNRYILYAYNYKINYERKRDIYKREKSTEISMYRYKLLLHLNVLYTYFFCSIFKSTLLFIINGISSTSGHIREVGQP